ncbi:GPP34 family phosphoprotein [Streptomyces echinoruber]|uniref:GPP34 family phosphoprotein n=1 Tax=Streptomyces echinoruber TaxID=68898 RepID=A0A918RP69_9ACTN|nr:GPP34 family phosphoprotein [Streptomyces echinoruber]GHA07594.1 hypothetical protein GCM10010389_53570 [Streptomyces echinoruber]
MSTARDLVIVAMDVTPSRTVTQGDLSLALAGAELIDLLRAEAVALAGDRIVPRLTPPLEDPLLERAAAFLLRDEPYESVEDWLWRRGRGLAREYVTALREEGVVSRARGSWLPFRRARPVPADSSARRRAVHRWEADEPVLVTLAAAAGVREDVPEDVPVLDEAAQTVFAAVVDATTELDAVRRRRAIEDAAFANIWRGA